MVVGRVQRLVLVADEVEQELEGDQPLLRTRARRREFGRELVDLVDHTVLRGTRARWLIGRGMTEARGVLIRGAVDLGIDEVPAGGLAMPTAAVDVRPGRLRLHFVCGEGVLILREQRVDLGAHRGGEFRPRDQGDDLMSLEAPRLGRPADSQGSGGGEKSGAAHGCRLSALRRPINGV